jgi:hypothetical protein
MVTIRCRPGEGAPVFVQRVVAGLDAPQGAIALVEDLTAWLTGAVQPRQSDRDAGGREAAAARQHRRPGCSCPAATDYQPHGREHERPGLAHPRHHRPWDRLRGGGSPDSARRPGLSRGALG